jgi:Protein of unknown function (DUF2971)
MKFIYKYFGNDIIEKAFSKKEACTVKFSLPKDYNDPYELFLAMDLNAQPDDLAFYKDIINELPQIPTSCFSQSPIITPMWAHYAVNHSGFMVEYDTQKLTECFPHARLENINYRDSPVEHLGDALAMASTTAKPRHTFWLRQNVFSAAYFSKHTHWSYEREVRLVDTGSSTVMHKNMHLLDIPIECVSALIVGKNASEMLKQLSLDIAKTNDIGWYQMCIGRSYPYPYLKDSEGDAFIFTDNEIIAAEHTCDNCNEPITNDAETCPWCSIEDQHEFSAAQRNPYRLLDHFGLLEDYIDSASAIAAGTKETE